MRKISTVPLLFLIVITTTFGNAGVKEEKLYSPDKRICLGISIKGDVEISVDYLNNKVIKLMKASITEGKLRIPAINRKVKKTVRSSINRQITLSVPLKNRTIRDHYNELGIFLGNGWGILFRAYNEGIAYRFYRVGKKEIKITKEDLSFSLGNPGEVFFPEEKSTISHYERLYLRTTPSKIEKDSFCSLPVLFKSPDNISILITEADQHNYPGMFLKKGDGTEFKSFMPPVPLEIKASEKGRDRNEIILEEADYIASIKGRKSLPWRVFMISGEDKDLIKNEMVYLLSTAAGVDNTDWIKPGKVAWDWWNANNIMGVDFKSGINTRTYKYYIDFASTFGLEYIIMDEGWSKSTTDIMSPSEDVDVREIIDYGKKKGVGVILWVLWKPLDMDLKKVLKLYNSWGVAGIKVDFMQRADQYMVNFYERVASEAFKNRLLVDFHGSFKPAGLRRTWPNIMSYEGVKGLENNKWSKDITPQHNLTLPFIRMVAGPMDYTPGAMRNFHKKNFNPVFERPGSMGTRCHQLAMYVVYESPLQMLSDTPTSYYKERECACFISEIPTVWDKTVVVEGEIGEHLVLARRSGNKWFIGAMTNEKPRKFNVPLNFLDSGKWSARIMKDGVNSDRIAEDYKYIEKVIDTSGVLKIELNSGGGWVAILSKNN